MAQTLGRSCKGGKNLGIDITDEQIAEMEAKVDDIDYDYAAAREKEVRHDVMAHVLTFGYQCPKAKPVIHLGATSCFVGDNTDIIQMRDALLLIRGELLSCIKAVRDFAVKNKGLATLAYTHFQAAQPTTVGKRATLWLQDLVSDLDNLDFQLSRLRLLGCKGRRVRRRVLWNFSAETTKKSRLSTSRLQSKRALSGRTP